MEEKILDKLQNVFHLESFRPLQKEIIADVLNNRDILTLMPTGGGKSLCFQLPATLTSGLTIVISPLISLIFDQILGLEELGIPACFWNSQTSAAERQNILKSLRSPETIPEEEQFKLMYTTPETLTTNFSLMDLLKDLYEADRIARFVIDEAHCVSNWGHEFRPSYLDLRTLKEAYPNVPVAAFTATAIPKVQMDIIKQLNLSRPKLYKQSFIRPNITYSVKTRPSSSTETLENVAEWIREHYPNGSGIIYCLSRKKCEETAMELIGMGVSADFYHARINPKRKEEVQRNWLEGKIQIIVATIAFALGINKPDVRFVIHLAMPKSIEGYYQEAGRAGRDRQPSECLLYYSIQDKIILESMVKKDSRAPVSSITKLNDMYDFCTNVVDCRKRQLSQYLGEHRNYACKLGCDVCLKPFPTKNKSIKDVVELVLLSLIKDGKAFAQDTNDIFKYLCQEIRAFSRSEIKRILYHILGHGIIVSRAILTKSSRDIRERYQVGPAISSNFNMNKLNIPEILAFLKENSLLEMPCKNEAKITDFFRVPVKPKKQQTSRRYRSNRSSPYPFS